MLTSAVLRHYDSSTGEMADVGFCHGRQSQAMTFTSIVECKTGDRLQVQVSVDDTVEPRDEDVKGVILHKGFSQLTGILL